MARRGAGGPAALSRVAAKLKKATAEGRYYDAQQMTMTLFYRHRPKKKGAGDLSTCLGILEEGALAQLEHHQFANGTELGLQLCKAYKEDGIAGDAAAIGRVKRVLQAFPRAGEPEVVRDSLQGCQRFAGAALKWARGAPGEPGELRELFRHINDFLGDFLWAVHDWKGLGLVAPFYITSGNVEKLAGALHKASVKSAAVAGGGGKPDRDLFVVRAGLEILEQARSPGELLARLPMVRALVAAFAALHQGDMSTLDTPLVRYLDFLCQAIEKQSEPLAKLLLREYTPALQKDKRIMKLATLCTVTLNPSAASGPPGMAGGFGDIFKALMG